jgi:DNA-binding transcriptional ArsR family regulator
MATDLTDIQANAAAASSLLRSIGNEHRLTILCLLLIHAEMSAGELGTYLPLSQSAFSQHLARMRQDGLIAHRREGQTLYYRIDNPHIVKIITTLKDIYCP